MDARIHKYIYTLISKGGHGHIRGFQLKWKMVCPLNKGGIFPMIRHRRETQNRLNTEAQGVPEILDQLVRKLSKSLQE